MVLKFYGHLASPPVRAVYMTMKHLGLPVEMVDVSLFDREHKSEEYMKINPLGTVPCIADDGFVLLDSHAINVYLATKYPEGEKLYPSDPKKRAIVNERLFFECGELFGVLKVAYIRSITKGLTEMDEDAVMSFEKGYSGLETYLKNSQFIAGANLTIADFSVVASLSNMRLFVPVDKERFPLVSAYLERAVTWPFYAEVIEAGVQKGLEYMKSKNVLFLK